MGKKKAPAVEQSNSRSSYHGQTITPEQFWMLPESVRSTHRVDGNVMVYDSTPNTRDGKAIANYHPPRPANLPATVGTIGEQRTAFDGRQAQIAQEQQLYAQQYQEQLAAQQAQYQQQLQALQNQYGSQGSQQQASLAEYQRQLQQIQQEREAQASQQGGLLTTLQQQLQQTQGSYQQQLSQYQQQMEAQRAESQGLLTGLQTQFQTQLKQRDEVVGQLQSQYAKSQQDIIDTRNSLTGMLEETRAQAALQQAEAQKAQLQMEQRLSQNTTQALGQDPAKAGAGNYKKMAEQLRGTAQLPQDFLRGSASSSLLRR